MENSKILLVVENSSKNNVSILGNYKKIYVIVKEENKNVEPKFTDPDSGSDDFNPEQEKINTIVIDFNSFNDIIDTKSAGMIVAKLQKMHPNADLILFDT